MSGPAPAHARWIAWFAIMSVAVIVSSGLTIALALRLRGEEDRLTALRREAEACPKRVVRADTPLVEHVDAPVSQPLGADAYIEYGTDITPLLRLQVERVRPRGGAELVRVGAPEVLSPRSIHVVGLWATWCSSCKQLFPRIREVFERRGDWGEAVRFVPIQVLDPATPDLAVSHWRSVMPDSRVQLADRSSRDELVNVLRDEQRRLYAGTLPVVLILDCNRRVRWAKLGPFAANDLEDLERRADQFIAELHEQGSRCSRVWCGNGRCEPGEDRCTDDCGAAAPRSIAPSPTPTPVAASRPPSPSAACPEGCPACDTQGRCRALWGEPSAPPVAPAARPDADCRKRGCTATLECRLDATGAHSCQPPGLWASPD